GHNGLFHGWFGWGRGFRNRGTMNDFDWRQTVKGLAEILGRPVTMQGVLGQGVLDDQLDIVCIAPQERDRRRRLVQVTVEDFRQTACERRLAGKHLVENDSHGVYVSSRGNFSVFLRIDLLRRHIDGGTGTAGALLRQHGHTVRFGGEPCNSEVHQLGDVSTVVILAQENVGGFHIAVNDSMGVDAAQGVEALPGDAHALSPVKWFARVYPVFQYTLKRLPGDV